MSILRNVFGPSKKEIWESLSEQTGSLFVEGGLFKGADKVIAKHDDWTITLDTYTVSNGKSSTTFTRMRAPYVNADGFRFSIYRSGIFSEMGKSLGFQDIDIEDEEFDSNFVIKSTDEEKIRSLLNDPRIRELIDLQSRFHLEVKDDEGWFRKSFPEGVDELYFSVPGIIKDVEQLKGLFNVFSGILDRLCIIGSAYQSNPGIDL